jgi:hypothetical protein
MELDESDIRALIEACGMNETQGLGSDRSSAARAPESTAPDLVKGAQTVPLTPKRLVPIVKRQGLRFWPV